METKLTQKQVALIIGVSEDTITYWENGRNLPQIQAYPKIVRFLGYNPTQIDTSTFAGRIKKYRLNKGLSQKELAKLIKIDETSIRAWENGKRQPSIAKQRQVDIEISKED